MASAQSITASMINEAIIALKDGTKNQICKYIYANYSAVNDNAANKQIISKALDKGISNSKYKKGSTRSRYAVATNKENKTKKAETTKKLKSKPNKKAATASKPPSKPPSKPTTVIIPAVSPWDCCGAHVNTIDRMHTLKVCDLLKVEMDKIATNPEYPELNNKRYQSYQVCWKEYLKQEYWQYGKAHTLPSIVLDEILRRFPK